MKNLLFLIPFVSLLLAGCEGANIVASRWDSGINGAVAQTRCEQVDMRDKSDMNAVLGKYDGWKVIYISEFTTSNKTGTSAAICFERATK